MQSAYQVQCKIGSCLRLKNLCIDRYHKIRDEVNLIFFIEFSREERVKFWRHKSGLMANEDLFLPDDPFKELGYNSLCNSVLLFHQSTISYFNL
jgi:hypothetical protein